MRDKDKIEAAMKLPDVTIPVYGADIAVHDFVAFAKNQVKILEGLPSGSLR